MQKIENAVFHEGVQVACGGKQFLHCTFQNHCTLMLSTPGDAEFIDCRFGKRVVVRVPEAGATEQVASSHPTPPDGGSL
ncbi:MAG TPA: hypothetical protein VGP76_13245 [Planctomycetaceae bacterium]|jgi:hypothetical protein|nr:hypothetical protein [Planctomycetaceae bacterium]